MITGIKLTSPNIKHVLISDNQIEFLFLCNIHLIDAVDVAEYFVRKQEIS